MQAPTKYELAINLKTAKALGLDRAGVAARARRRGDRMKRREFIALLGGATRRGRSRRAHSRAARLIGSVSFASGRLHPALSNLFVAHLTIAAASRVRITSSTLGSPKVSISFPILRPT